MTKDLNKGISKIEYNLLNLPQQVDILSPLAEARNAYSYSADGVKLRVVKKYNSNFNTSPVIGSAVNVSSMDVTKTTDYVAGKIFENGTLDRIFVDGGYIKDGVYYFYETDHLGDNRTVVSQEDDLIERNDYYPYGMQMAHNQLVNQASGSDNKRKFSGKELDVMGGLNTYDFEARPYDLNYINFWTSDPKTEKRPWISPYVYCSDNPANRVDPDGRFDFAIPGVTPLPIWYIDMPATGKAMVELAKKAGDFLKTVVAAGIAQQVVTIERATTGENGQKTSQTKGENKTQDTKDEPDTRGQAQNKAKNHAKVPRESKGGENIEMDELNESSRGQNYENMKKNGAKSLGRRNSNGKNKYEEHPDGHADTGDAAHHDSGHFHSTNAKGEKKIFPYK